MFESRYEGTEKFFIDKRTRETPLPCIHYHPTHEIYYAIDGERDIFIGNDFFKIKTGDLIMIPANSLHRASGKGALRFLIYFNDECLKSILNDCAISKLIDGQPLVFRANANDQAELKNMLYHMLEEYNDTRRLNKSVNEFRLAGQIFNLLFFLRTRENNYVNSENQTVTRMRLIIQYIHDNYANPLTLQGIADEFGITKDHLCHMFTQNMGISLFVYLNNLRIKKACDLIKTSDATLLDVALSCGFCSYHYFCRVFKREMGISPGEYRKINAK